MNEPRRTTLNAVYVRTLKPGVTDDEFVAAWLPPHHTRDSYPAEVRISRSTTDERQVMSVFRLEVDPEDLPTVLTDLVHPAAEERLGRIVDSTELAAVYVDREHFGRSVPE